MVYLIRDSQGKKLYIKGKGKFFYLARDKKGALNQIPKGWQIVRFPNGRLYLKRKS